MQSQILLFAAVSSITAACTCDDAERREVKVSADCKTVLKLATTTTLLTAALTMIEMTVCYVEGVGCSDHPTGNHQLNFVTLGSVFYRQLAQCYLFMARS